MVSGRMLLLSASCWLLVVLGSSEELIEERSPEDDAIKTREVEELIEALQEVLEKLKNKQLPSSEKKLGWLPAASSVRCVKVRGSGSCVDVPEEPSVTSPSSNVCNNFLLFSTTK
ncbi:uncharacterized protein LOC119487814 isoform X1 [Sebastes umbrosus]|uniref:uncharacterized protein LOC119487814 isoform X1 n=1 Tax=Sebastes umbrosus TaxID=72105 RepID=UPI00189F07A0|nr:uncharacterized protein LOC119487814 isoform X1 [Sebastes umbrosus]